jgi:hypothetical protein
MTVRATEQWEEPEGSAVNMTAPEDPTANDIVVFTNQAAQLAIVDEPSLKSAALFVEQCKLAARRVEDKRTAQVKPLNEQVKSINEVLIPVRDAFLNLARRVDERMGKFLEDCRLAAEEKQRQAQAAAAAKQAELDRKAEEERRKAEEATKAGDVKGAVQAEAKAIKFEQKAAETVAQVVPQVSGSIDLGDSNLGIKAAKKDWSLVGWDRKRPLPALDALLAPLHGELDKLPEGIRFLLQYSDLNPVRLNAAYKAGTKFPKPFDEVKVYGGSTLRSS